jgi:hypothetical protein
VAQVLGLRPHAESGPNDAESLLCTGLSFGVAHEAAQHLDAATGAQERRRAVADGVALENAGPLAPGHLFNWAWMGAVRRAGLQRLEAAMGHDGASLRSHVLQPRKVRVDDGLAVVCTAEEFSANEDFILAHLRGR